MPNTYYSNLYESDETVNIVYTGMARANLKKDIRTTVTSVSNFTKTIDQGRHKLLTKRHSKYESKLLETAGE